MDQYPRSNQSVTDRAGATDEDRRLASQFGQAYFDGQRRQGYGGYEYDPRFWTKTVRRIRDHYQLLDDASILDVGCAKGFMLHDFRQLMPKARLAGVDISKYAIEQAIADVKPLLQLANADVLPFDDNSFDLVISIATVHNLPEPNCIKAIKEIQRVSKTHAFIVVGAYRNEQEQQDLDTWGLTQRTKFSVRTWKEKFGEIGYTGDYYWFMPHVA